MATRIEAAARIMEHLCEHAAHGYAQDARNGQGACSLDIDGETYVFPGGDADCSSAIIRALSAAGFDTAGASYTGNMRSCLCATGAWESMPMSYTAHRGDIYLNEANHTAMCTSAVPDMLAEFSINENGGISGGQVGDQTGRESRIAAYYDYPWDCILKCTDGAQASGNSSACEQARPSSGDDAGDGVVYEVHTSAGWLGAVGRCDSTEDGYAGWVGMPIDGVRCMRDDGAPVTVSVHLLGGDWTAPTVFTDSLFGENSFGDGFSGDFGHPIDAIRVDGCEVRVACGGDYFGWLKDGGTPEGDDFAGDYGSSITAVQMRA